MLNCDNGQYVSSNKCLSCSTSMSNCLQCTASNVCTLCANTYLINYSGNGCVASCASDEIANANAI